MEKYIKILLICTTVILSVNISVITISFIMEGTVILAAWMVCIGFTTIFAFLAHWACHKLLSKYKALMKDLKQMAIPCKKELRFDKGFRAATEVIIDQLK